MSRGKFAKYGMGMSKYHSILYALTVSDGTMTIIFDSFLEITKNFFRNIFYERRAFYEGNHPCKSRYTGWNSR